MSLFFAGFLFGLIGNFHCLGMCGPLLISLQQNRVRSEHGVIKSFLYQLGRIFSYVFLGLILGFLGEGFFIGGLLQALSICLGVLLFLHALNHFVALPFLGKSNFLFAAYQKLQSLILPLLNKGSFSSTFILGALNGMLPCGLVYMGLAGAMASGSWFYGLQFMGGFGLGTVPVMLFLMLGWLNLSEKLRGSMLRVIPGLQLLMALLLIMRGLNLGLPYVSPEWPEANGLASKSTCHVPAP